MWRTTTGSDTTMKALGPNTSLYTPPLSMNLVEGRKQQGGCVKVCPHEIRAQGGARGAVRRIGWGGLWWGALTGTGSGSYERNEVRGIRGSTWHVAVPATGQGVLSPGPTSSCAWVCSPAPPHPARHHSLVTELQAMWVSREARVWGSRRFTGALPCPHPKHSPCPVAPGPRPPVRGPLPPSLPLVQGFEQGLVAG